VRHRGAAALFTAKGFLQFTHLGALQVANFLRDAFEGRGDRLPVW